MRLPVNRSYQNLEAGKMIIAMGFSATTQQPAADVLPWDGPAKSEMGIPWNWSWIEWKLKYEEF